MSGSRLHHVGPAEIFRPLSSCEKSAARMQSEIIVLSSKA